MILQGTIANVVAVILGSSVGLVIGRRLPARITKLLFSAIGLFTLYLGISLALETKDPLVVLISIVLGTTLGSALQLDMRMERLLDRVAGKSGSAGAGTEPEISPEEPARIAMKGLLGAFLLFCIGSMTILGSLQEGLGNGSELLFTKSILDGLASIALTSIYGRVILLVTIPLFLYQASLTLGAGYLAPFLTDDAMADLNGVGGILLLGLGLDILEIKRIPVLDLMPALFFAPLMANLWA